VQTVTGVKGIESSFLNYSYDQVDMLRVKSLMWQAFKVYKAACCVSVHPPTQ
jgi:hypothetical protein